MCGRYYVEPESDMEELAELIAEAKRKSDEVKTGEVFPSDTAAVIANSRQLKPAVFPMRWGFERRGGGLGCHLNAREFLPHVDDHEYPAGALAAAVYLAGGVRGMERGTLSEQREPDGTEPIAEVELLRLAMPRRVFTMSQVLYAVDRITWLHENRDLVGGLRWVEEASSLRFFFGRLESTSDWQEKLVKKFRDDFGDSL